MPMRQITVTEHLLLHEKKSVEATGRFTALLNDIILAAKIIGREVNKAGLVDVLGFTGDHAAAEDHLKKLDVYANDIFVHRLQRSGVLCAMASEEVAEMILVPEEYQRGDYVLVFDPLDGYTNIDANVTIGSIFGIYRRVSAAHRDAEIGDFLQQGMNQVGAGYVIYGSSTMLVYTTGHGVHGFTLDPSVGEFLLSHPDIRVPEKGRIYSTNEGHYHYWDEPTREVMEYFKGADNHLGAPYSSRYIGSLVADFHRNLLYGGIFMYPMDYRNPKSPKGKLRLVTEANPLAMIVEQAGGLATDGRHRILDIKPTDLHQRVPLFIGSEYDVRKVTDIYRKYDASHGAPA